jgi:hypothetical protein
MFPGRSSLPRRFRFASPSLWLVAGVGLVTLGVLLSVWVAGPAAAAPAGSTASTAAARPQDPALATFFPGAGYAPEVPSPQALLGRPLASRPANWSEISRCLTAWAESSPRVRRHELGSTWEGRTLQLAVITSPENHARLDEIRRGWARIADPRRTGAEEAERLAASLPAVAWLAFSIHGDEVSPADAGLALAYHLAAAQGPEIERLLADLVVVIDPLQNPDGRDRFLARVAETAGAVPNHDEQSVEQRGSWPWGRGNHYLFDLNRDWTFATQPETRARLRALASWQPLFLLDVHEMELANQSFLFYPPRAPFNPFLPPTTRRWWEVFGLDEARAFDREGWRYYTGEWADWWFPGYTDSLVTLRGGIGILHEQAGIAAGSVRLESGRLLRYEEAVHHQVTAAWANLETLARHRAAIGRDFAATRRRAMAPDGPLAGRVLAVVPDGNRSRLARFAEVVALHGGEMSVSTRPLEVPGRDGFGRQATVTLPAGTLLVGANQPEGHLLRAILDFDIPLPEDILARERAALVRGGETLLYDITGWSLPLLYGLEAYELTALPESGTVAFEVPLDGRARVPADAVTAAAEVLAWLDARTASAAAGGASSSPATGSPNARSGNPPDRGTGGPPSSPPSPFGWVFDGADDRSVVAAARLLAAGFVVRLADADLALDGVVFPRGAVVALRDDNRERVAALAAAAAEVAGAVGLPVHEIATGWGPGDLPDLGGRHLRLLVAPKLGLIGYGSADPAEYGALWYALDRELGVALSALRAEDLAELDLRRYNVLVLAPGVLLDAAAAEALRAWTIAGGTLVAVERAAAEVAAAEVELTTVRELAAVTEVLADYRADLLASWPRAVEAEVLAAAQSTRVAEGVAEPSWSGVEEPDAPWSPAEAARRAAAAELFLPQGAILAGRLDGGHWLTVGRGAELPLFVGPGPILLARRPVEVVARLGVLAPSPAGELAGAAGSIHERPRWRALGWGAVPAGHDLLLRVSGLLWPEAAEQLANSAYLTREAVGAGQVILFSGQPVYRGATLGSARLFANAVVYGPGCGTRVMIAP